MLLVFVAFMHSLQDNRLVIVFAGHMDKRPDILRETRAAVTATRIDKRITDPAIGADAETDVKLTVEEPSGVQRIAWPVTSGIPMSQGALNDDKAAALLDADGEQIAIDFEVERGAGHRNLGDKVQGAGL